MYDRSFQMRDVLNEISVLAHFFLAPVNISWIWIAINNIISIDFNRKPKMALTRMLWSYAQCHEPIVVCRVFFYDLHAHFDSLVYFAFRYLCQSSIHLLTIVF